MKAESLGISRFKYCFSS